MLRNPAGADEAAVSGLFASLLPLALSGVGDAFGTFPLPDVLGMTLRPIEISRQDSTVTIFANLEPAPAP